MSANPFDARTVLRAKHAQHVVLIHFPIAVLWWVVLLLGLATYARWYVPHLFRK